MATAVALIGVFGAVMGFLGSLAALFMGGVGVAAGVEEASGQTLRSFGAMAVSLVALAAALTARNRLRATGFVLLGSAVIGLLLVTLFYAVGAVLVGAAGLMAVRGERTV